MGVGDRPPNQEVKEPTRSIVRKMEAADYETAEMRLSGRLWWCYSITLGTYWRPDTGGVDTWAGPDAPGHWPQCGWFTDPPTPNEEEGDDA